MADLASSLSAQRLRIEADGATSEVLHEWLDAKTIAKDAEATIEKLKPKVNMLIPVDGGVRTYAATLIDKSQKIIGKLVVARKRQNRQKTDIDKLTELLRSKDAPPEAFKSVASEEYVAEMVKDGRITMDELRACMTGKIVYYPQIDFVADATE